MHINSVFIYISTYIRIPCEITVEILEFLLTKNNCYIFAYLETVLNSKTFLHYKYIPQKSNKKNLFVP